MRVCFGGVFVWSQYLGDGGTRACLWSVPPSSTLWKSLRRPGSGVSLGVSLEVW